MTDLATANVMGALALALVDRIDRVSAEILERSGEAPAALVVIGYGRGMTNDALARVLGRSHSGTVRLVDRLVADGLVERRPGPDARSIALHLTKKGSAQRRRLLSARLDSLGDFLAVLSVDERTRLDELARALLARHDTSEAERHAICRLCDNGVCTRCPLPTGVGARAGGRTTPGISKRAPAQSRSGVRK